MTIKKKRLTSFNWSDAIDGKSNARHKMKIENQTVIAVFLRKNTTEILRLEYVLPW